MLTKRLISPQYSTSTYLTIALVAGIVLINSVAWGIPLLVGPQLSGPPVNNPSKTPAIRKTLIAKSAARKVSKELSVVRHRAEIPLPQKAPAPPLVRRNRIDLADNNIDSESAQTRGRPSGVPTTLFPRPEAAPSPPLANLAASLAMPSHDEKTPPLSRQLDRETTRQPAGEIVFASPYTPGVRVTPNAAATPAWSHLSGEDAAETSTLATAKAIARRAAQRFEQMRDRMARLDTERSLIAAPDGHQAQTVLPVAPRPPRIIDSGGRNVSKSASNFVRPRLVRRPLKGDKHEQQATQHAGLTTSSLARPNLAATRRAPPAPRQKPATVSSRRSTALTARKKPQRTQRVKRNKAPKIGTPVRSSRKRLAALRKRLPKRRIARAAPQAVNKRADKVHATKPIRIRAASKRVRRKSAKRRVHVARASHGTRRLRLRRTHRGRRSTRRINGFRRKFHRDLVMAGFFQASR